ncbi:GAF domain-containing SpoIIE family protein phosphatase [Streptomyces sp. CA2R106]|uniref:GAF domain-containing SpoIIE family protein phosphatase n=1 Tax=Streptomyces sp. CA2R106 TaxID=3120153 RepID=UPI003008691C
MKAPGARAAAAADDRTAEPDHPFGRSTAVFAQFDGPAHLLRSANPAFHDILGTDAAALGRPLAHSVPELAEQGLTALLDDVYRTGRRYSGQDILVRLDAGGHSHEAYFDLTVEPRHRHGSRQVCGVRLLGVDITPVRHAQALAAEQRALLEQIARDAPVHEVLAGMTRTIEELSPGVIASVLLADTDGLHLRHGAAPGLPDFYNEAIDGLPTGEGMGSCGTAAHRRRPVVATDIATDPSWVDYRDLAHRAGLAACWSTPIISSTGRLLGTFAMYHRTPRAPQPSDLALSSAFARIAALAVERHRAEEARAIAEAKEKAAREDLAFLLQAGTALGRDLDYEQTLRHLAELCVPDLAPVCVVDAVADGRMRRIAALAAEPRAQHLLDVHADGAVPAAEPPGSTRIARGAPDLPGPWAALDVTGHVRIPLRERGRGYGTLTLLTTGDDPLDWRRVALAEELAHRASTVARHARQYRDRARLAHDLQAGLLLADMPELPGGELAAYYRPAGEGLDIGGDFYDVFALPGDRWAFMIGDVCGRGAPAATITALVRHTARAVAPLLGDPVAVAGAINTALLERAPDSGGDFVTLVYGHLLPRPDRLDIDLVRAGHLMPVHHRPGRPPEPVRSEGMLLGAFPDAVPEPAALRLRAGESLMLATDGITESRDRGGREFGEAGITRALARVQPVTAPDMVSTVTSAVARHTAGVPTDDDQALLVLTAR